MKICPKCGSTHDKNGTFCSRSCANSRERSEELRKRVSESIKKSEKFIESIEKNKLERVDKVCPICKNKFQITINDKKIYCSKKCYLEDSELKYRKKVSGGYREGSGRSKSGYYKGIYCGSTYELAWVIYQIDNNIEFQRFNGMLEFEGKKYIPDFIQNGKIIEIKGYEKEESVEKKNLVAKENGFEVSVLRKENLTKEFAWVESKYKTKEFYTLYDEYKPKYEYVCDYCNNIFRKERKIITKHKFCNRFCAGKGHKGRKNKVLID